MPNDLLEFQQFITKEFLAVRQDMDRKISDVYTKLDHKFESLLSKIDALNERTIVSITNKEASLRKELEECKRELSTLGNKVNENSTWISKADSASSRRGGWFWGILGTVISALVVWYFTKG